MAEVPVPVSERVPSESPFVVLKFGGTSVAAPEQWRVVAQVVEQRLHEGVRPIVVHSALPGMTDLLTALLEADATTREEGVTSVAQRMLDLAVRLKVDDDAQGAMDRELDALRSALADLPRAVAGDRDLGPEDWRRQAEVIAAGERLLTPIGVAWLRGRGLDVGGLAAPDLLSALADASEGPRRWLSAECTASSDPEVVSRIDRSGHGVIVTQGFLARDPATGGTVLLGRGGSDTAAACLAGNVDARRLEIWSDVPGMFSADPRLVPGARLIPELDYAEAQEIATTGSRVLHPRCIPALRRRRIPIHLRSSRDPESPGTRILPDLADSHPGLRAVSRKNRVLLLSIETVGMWQEVGFLARALGVIAAEGLSIDLVSTSETNVTVSLDGDANMIDRGTIARLVSALREFASVEVIPGCAAVSLVGRNVRRQLHRLGPIFEVFEEHRIHLVSQAANDLNFTVVVDEAQAGRLVERLHEVLVGGVGTADGAPEVLGEVAEAGRPGGRVPRGVGRWWRDRVDALIDIAADGPAYVYDLRTVRDRAVALTAVDEVDRVLYAMKANWNASVLTTCRAAGTGFECVSPGELRHLETTFPGFRPDEVMFTPNFAGRTEYADALGRGYTVTLDALHPIEAWPELFAGRDIFLRIDPGWGRGHHEKVVTGGRHSKFGIPLFELDRTVEALDAAGTTVRGLHTHSGSDILDGEHWVRVGRTLASLRTRFPDVEVLNLGGGLGVPPVSGAPPISLERLAAGLRGLRQDQPGVEIWLEPGRWLVAEAGVLLGRVTQTKGKGDMRYIGLDVGMNSLLRPALYGAHHEIVNLSRLDDPSIGPAQIVGPICESGDRLGVDRPFPETEEGDVVLVDLAGAYGRVMASHYNMRDPAREVVLPIR